MRKYGNWGQETITWQRFTALTTRPGGVSQTPEGAIWFRRRKYLLGPLTNACQTGPCQVDMEASHLGHQGTPCFLCTTGNKCFDCALYLPGEIVGVKCRWDHSGQTPKATYVLPGHYPWASSTQRRPTSTTQTRWGTQPAKLAGAAIKCDSGHWSRWTHSLRRRGGRVAPTVLIHLGPWREIYELLYSAAMQGNCRIQQHILCAGQF